MARQMARQAQTIKLVKAWLPFLGAASLEPRLERDYLWIGDAPALRIHADAVVYRAGGTEQRAEATKAGVDGAIRAILIAGFRVRLQQNAEAAVPPTSPIRTELSELGLNLFVGGQSVGSVEPDEAVIGNRRHIRSNFLTSGPHWRMVFDACQHEASRSVDEVRQTDAANTPGVPLKRASALTVVADVPPGLRDSLVQECLAASRDIRLNRTVVLGHSAELRSRSCVLRVDPIRLMESRLGVPFTYRQDGEVVEGALTIEGASDPLRIIIYDETLTRVGRQAWAACLLGFRALSTPEPTSTPTDHVVPRPRGGASARLTQSATRSSRPPAGSRPYEHWSSSLQLKRGGTHAPHWVVGHKRVLPNGQDASTRKKAEAARYGITLRAGETWVTPHTRGVAPGAVMEFRWTPPASLIQA